MLPDVTVPAPVVTLACVIAVAICVGETPSAATCFGFSWTFSCICCTPERVTACTPSMACRWGTTRVPSSVASCSGGRDEVTASCTTGMLVKLSAATFGAWAVAGSICCTPDTDCWTSASLAFMSGHEGQGGRGPAVRVGRAADTARNGPGAEGRGAQLHQHAGGAAGGDFVPAAGAARDAARHARRAASAGHRRRAGSHPLGRATDAAERPAEAKAGRGARRLADADRDLSLIHI